MGMVFVSLRAFLHVHLHDSAILHFKYVEADRVAHNSKAEATLEMRRMKVMIDIEFIGAMIERIK